MASIVTALEYTDPTTHKAIKINSATVKFDPQKLAAALAPYLKQATPAPPPVITPPSPPPVIPPAPPSAVIPAVPLSTGSPAFAAVPVGVSASLSSIASFFGPDHPFNQDVSTLPVSPRSAAIIGNFGGNHITFDSSIPHVVVDSSVTPFRPIGISQYADDGDFVQVPISNPLPAGSVEPGSDLHACVLDKFTGIEYDMFQFGLDGSSNPVGDTQSGALCYFDLTQNNPRRTYTLGSSDAAGLPLLPLLPQYDRLLANQLQPMRVTFRNSIAKTMSDPATHDAGTLGQGGLGIPIMGMCFRLKSTWQPQGQLSQINQALVNCLKKRGMYMADNGNSGAVQIASDARWNGDDLLSLVGQLRVSDFEVVDRPVFTHDTLPSGAAPTISSFTCTRNGNSMDFTWSVAGHDYLFINGGTAIQRQAKLTVPYVAGSYTLVARNRYATVTAVATIA